MHEKDDTMLNDFSFLVFYHPCCQNVVKTQSKKCLFYGDCEEFPQGSILSSPAPERVRNALFISFSGFFVFAGK